jgi:Tfp pilus assembly protein PilE
MTRSKGFFFIELIYAFCLVSVLMTVCLNQYAQVNRVLQECTMKATALLIAQNELESLRSHPLSLADHKKIKDYILSRTAFFETVTPRYQVYHIRIVVTHAEQELVSLQTGVLYEHSY